MKTKCCECGKEVNLNFELTGEKPYRCDDCFRVWKEKQNRRRTRLQKPMVKATCSKCGRECEVPFKPTGEKPILCKECFEDSRS